MTTSFSTSSLRQGRTVPLSATPLFWPFLRRERTDAISGSKSKEHRELDQQGRGPEHRGHTLEIRHRSSGELGRYVDRAGAPRVLRRDAGDSFVIELEAPGARHENTELVWDEARRRLVVAVWAVAPPRPGEPRRFPLPELAWYRAFESSEGELSRASARIRRGNVELTVPKRVPDKPFWEP